MRFEWDESKAKSNLLKHGVSFVEAASVFDDPMYVDFYDDEHAVEAHRFLMVGESLGGRLLLVSYEETGDIIRIISSRELTATERKIYEEGQ